MMKKLFAVLLILALTVGALSMTATAAGTTKAAIEAYEVGYAKVDINPYWQEWVDWSNASSNDIPDGIRGTIPYEDFYDEYDMLPLPMGGYGNNTTRLSRPKLMDDNGSGVGASKTNVTNTSRYYKKSDGTYATASSTGHYTALYTRSGNWLTGYTYTKDTNYQDVHLSSNRYTKDFAAEMGVTYSDGVYGENDGDGVWATCVLVKDPQSNSPLLIIGIDNIGVQDTLIALIKQSILAQSEVQAIGLTEDRILINSNHTHGSVALSTSYSSTNTTTTYTLAEGTFEDESYTFTAQQLYWYLNFYKNHLREQLAAAAVEAVGDLETAQTMEKGTIDASEQTGYQLNGVRHNVQTYYGDPELTYVRGSSFNNDMDGDGSNDSHTGSDSDFSKSTPVSESDDSLHILKFTFENKDPIVMVNFRAHSTANNKQAAKLLHYNISSDWVSPLRYELEQQGYRFSLLYGSSGNLGTGYSNGDNDIIPHSYANYSSTSGCWELPATPYARQIAQITLALLGDVTENNNAIVTDMHEVTMGKIQSLRTSHLLAKQEWSPLAYAAALAYFNDGSPTYGGRYTINDGDTVTYDTASITLGKGEGGTFVVASQYHAKNIKSKYETQNNVHIELNAILMGSEVAFATTPVEASDRYSTKEIAGDSQILTNGVSNYNENDWDKLIGDTWGTPFVLSLTNGSHGYVPNQLAYDYGKSYTGTDYMVAVGSYESQTSWANRGEGENMVATLNKMLHSVEPITADCEHCGPGQSWYPLSTAYIDANNSHNLAAGHYYLASDFDYDSYARISEGVQVCIDLNGFTYSAESYAAASRAFNLYGTLNVQDSSENKTGKMQGYGVRWATSTGFSAGTITIGSGGTLNLYSGSLTMNHVDGYGPYHGGVLSVGGTFNMYGGKVYGGIAENGVEEATDRNGGNIYVAGGTFNMYDGQVYDGTAGNLGGNLYISSGTASLLGGTMEGGNAVDGGNIYAAGGTLTINGTNVTGGTATGNGGTLYTAGGTVKLQSGTLGGGTAVNGGGAYLAHAATLTGGTISGGTAENGGALYVAGISQTLSGTNISGGNATNGGTVYLPEGATLVTTSGTTISGGEAENGGTLYVAGGTLTMVEGATLSGGSAANGGCIYLPEGATLSIPAGVTVSGGEATNGGNVYIAGGTLNLSSGATISGGSATNGGNVYFAAGNLNMVTGATVSDGSATKGGNLYIAPEASYTMTAGTLSGGSATSGGNVHIPADAEFTLSGGTVTAGTATSNGGNVFVAADGSFTMNSGELTDGRAEKEGAQPTGGNVYTAGSFTLNGGSITGGHAYYGGNVQVQNNAAIFTMTGGTISGGTAGYSTNVANLCTSTNSNFRLEGGYIAGTAYVQGYVTLSGTTTGATPIRLYVKEAADRLTVEGTYIGKINLVFNNTFSLGSKIGNANNANIGAAQITAEDYSELSVAVVGNELQLAVPEGSVAKIGNTYFDNFADAFTAYDDPTAPVVLLENADLGVLPKDVTLDLNGYSVTAVDTDGNTLTVLDTTTADYDSPDADSYGTVPAVTGIRAAAGYMDIAEGGKISFHKYEMELQYVNISPSKKGISYTTTFKGDQVVKSQVKEFGIAMRLYAAPNATTIWADPDRLTHVALSQSEWQTGNNAEAIKSVYIKNILDWDLSDDENYTRAQIDIYGRSYIQLQNGTMIFSTAVSFSMQSAMEEADSVWDELEADAQEALVDMYLNEENHGFMERWNLPNIKFAAGETNLDVTL